MFGIFGNHGILGINARNLFYTKPLNPKKAIRLADSKLATKQFLSARGIPVPKLITALKTHAELQRFSFASLPSAFVIKPNSGLQGEGILVIHGRDENGFFRTVSGKKYSEDDLREHLGDILDGKYSITSLPDIILFEQLLTAAPLIPNLPSLGLPDVRIIVKGLVPIMAMLRYPTQESDGKANIHLGAYGFGVDLGTGATTYAVYRGRIRTRLLSGADTRGYRIPHFDDMLNIAVRAQYHTNLGYLAADIVLDKKEGPVLMEINARAGLAVQLANRAGLAARLKKIDDLTLHSVTDGIALGKKLFSVKQSSPSLAEHLPIISSRPIVEVFETSDTFLFPAEISHAHEHTRIHPDTRALYRLKNPLKCRLGKERVSLPLVEDDSIPPHTLLLGERAIAPYLIRPSAPAAPLADTEKALCDIDKRLAFMHGIKPLNVAEERARFLDQGGDYSPQFTYAPLTLDLPALREKVSALKTDATPHGTLLQRKQQEVLSKIALLAAHHSADGIQNASSALFGIPQEHLVGEAKKQMRHRHTPLTRTIPPDTIAAALRTHLAHYELTDWTVDISTDLTANAVVSRTKKKILISDTLILHPDEVRALIAHELETHVLRAANGMEQPYPLLTRGTSHFLETEEGLAILNQNRFLPPSSERRLRPYITYLAIAFSLEHSFKDTAALLRTHAHLTLPESFSFTLKTKRGIADTSTAGAFTKGLVYLSGYEKVRTLADIRPLYIGKVALKELPLVSSLPGLLPPRHLPSFL